jgi:hypothetical protein
LHVLLAVLVAAAVLSVGSAARGAKPAQRSDACSWGASSIVAESVGGKIVVSQPQTSGCVPR